eukprot:CAMPEP_0201119570 /NCGR_PEP_ID=MMETSP0850-20130426/3681_1 /ASSEMBLY_ACC=CAM_ASM_000622 /TAXON_ID=183588 /ORGANISM="Pseudo-nitzschia fraudulenta, Strain WWA7" /LENGTH=111 /DNA_ID=CAMNT_0047385315 /DNA_START=1039 /DNA_END=1372 /DNA_ORIENTATION=+
MVKGKIAGDKIANGVSHVPSLIRYVRTGPTRGKNRDGLFATPNELGLVDGMEPSELLADIRLPHVVLRRQGSLLDDGLGLMVSSSNARAKEVTEEEELASTPREIVESAVK